MKETITQKILERLEDVVLGTGDLIGSILESGYGASMWKIEKNILKRQSDRARMERDYQKSIESKRKLEKLISKLKKDNLISSSGSGKNKLLKITTKGREKLLKYKNNNYSKEYFLKSNSSIIISFDIPEKYRSKRNWLRSILENSGFKMVQKSVWLGKVKLSQVFLDDLEDLKMLDFVEIFEVKKLGTL